MSNILKIGQKAFKVAAIFFLFYFYLSLYKFLNSTIDLIFLLWVSGSIVFSVYAFFSEKKKLTLKSEFFKKNNLFFRYGEEVLFKTIHIPVKEEWTPEESGSFGYKIIDKIKNQFIDSYGSNPLGGTQTVDLIGATDRERPTDARGFLRISFTGIRGAIFSRFITFQVLGKNVVIHLIAYLLGMPYLLDIIYFIIISPISIFRWALPWFRGEYSIYAALAKEINNSFEIIDMLAYAVSTKEIISDCIVAELKTNDLYNEKLATIIINTFNDSNINFGNQSFDRSVNNYGTNYGTIGSEIKQ